MTTINFGVQWHITDICNLRCKHCYREEQQKDLSLAENIKIFASSFQIFLREEYPIYLLMTGLYENIYDLQNEKSLTFLYRAPKIILEPLNYTAIKSHYMRIFDINDEMADKMTLLTRGYPFAFQVLGYLYWDNRKDHTLEDIMPEYDQYLDEYVYSNIICLERI